MGITFSLLTYFAIRYFYHFRKSNQIVFEIDNILTIIVLMIFQNAFFILSERYQEFILLRFKKAHDAEIQWLQSLKSIPNGITIYSLQE